jgi:hypothetical protein
MPHAFHFSVSRIVEVFEEGMIAGDLRDPIISSRFPAVAFLP